jgi:hypothetical protein
MAKSAEEIIKEYIGSLVTEMAILKSTNEMLNEDIARLKDELKKHG